MTWSDLHARTEIIDTVLARGAVDPADPRLLQDLPESERLFGGPAGILAALQYRWDNHVRAKSDLALMEGRSSAEVYRQLATEQPALRAILDAHHARNHRSGRVLVR
ncbi:hypothetical protein [Nocardia sp. alder85J]|uniref:hypothetical protein n=1 Tax=Nocardia sp. alder85J TaxID=2862949 RepID=UPI001CD6C298|nr:hypothetical protein [Nocardia sp. alder85J]MCX4093941.1 hypothetical protein [Nocardia sp. alder85J]